MNNRFSELFIRRPVATILLTIGIVFGGLLGVLFSVPLRRTMIVEDPLAFPEGKAAAEVLKAGESPGPLMPSARTTPVATTVFGLAAICRATASR